MTGSEEFAKLAPPPPSLDQAFKPLVKQGQRRAGRPAFSVGQLFRFMQLCIGKSGAC